MQISVRRSRDTTIGGISQEFHHSKLPTVLHHWGGEPNDRANQNHGYTATDSENDE